MIPDIKYLNKKVDAAVKKLEEDVYEKLIAAAERGQKSIVHDLHIEYSERKKLITKLRDAGYRVTENIHGTATEIAWK